jgi:hypothetical protein
MNNRCCAVAIGVGLALLARTAYAESDTLTQVGTWNCSIPPNIKWGDTGSYPSACPRVNFPTEFGGTPRLILTGCGGRVPVYQPYAPCVGPDFLTSQDVTVQGFTPTASLPGRSPDPKHPVAIPISGNWIAVGPRLFKGTATARYLVLSVFYAPPGANGGHASSSVSYGAGSTIGTTTSASRSFTTASTLSFSGSVGAAGNETSGELTFDYSQSRTDSNSLEFKKSVNKSRTLAGPAKDGIDHDEDIIFVWLNPSISLSVSSDTASWMLDTTQPSNIYRWRSRTLMDILQCPMTCEGH